MEDTYKGESPSKKYARFKFWLCVGKLLGREKFEKGKHLILASREGGDIPVLLTLGVRPKNIIAAEINPDAALAVQDKYPEIRVECADVVDIATYYKRSIDSAFLDFCSPARPDLIGKVIKTMNGGLRHGGVLGCAFLNGREKNIDVRKAIADRKATLVNFLNSFDEMSAEDLLLEYLMTLHEVLLPYMNYAEKLTDPRFPIDVREIDGIQDMADEMRDSLRTLAENTKSVSALARVLYVSSRIHARGSKIRCAPHIRGYLSYNSNTKRGKGIPMYIMFGTVFRGAGMSTQKFKRKFHKQIQGQFANLYGVECDLNEDQLRDMIFEEMDLMERSGYSSEGFHNFFNVSKRTLAAWKACRTRGCYD